MKSRIADTFTDPLSRLKAEEQIAVKITALNLHIDLSAHSLSFHKLDPVRVTNAWSVRVSAPCFLSFRNRMWLLISSARNAGLR
jgi:hypothetical protein